MPIDMRKYQMLFTNTYLEPLFFNQTDIRISIINVYLKCFRGTSLLFSDDYRSFMATYLLRPLFYLEFVIGQFSSLTLVVFSGAFLIPYFTFLLLCGMPLFYLEVVIGQFSSVSALHVWRMSPLFKGRIYKCILKVVSSDVLQ